MRSQPHSATGLVVALIALVSATGCGQREPSGRAYPYPAPASAAAPPMAYPSPIAQPQGPTVIGVYAASVFGLVVDDQMQVVHVEPGGGAERGSVQVGDLLRSIAGVAVRPGEPQSLWEARDAAAALQPPPPEAGMAVPFIIERNGSRLELAVAPAPLGAQGASGQPQPTVTPVLPPFDYL